VAKTYRIDEWRQLGWHVEVVTERSCCNKALAGACDYFWVSRPTTPCRRHLSQAVLDRLARAVKRGHKTTILYLGTRPPAFVLPEAVFVQWIKLAKPGYDLAELSPGLMVDKLARAIKKRITKAEMKQARRAEQACRNRFWQIATEFSRLKLAADEPGLDTCVDDQTVV